MEIYRRGKKGIFWLIRRVPKKYQEIEPKSRLQISLHSEERAIAEMKAKAIWQIQVDRWELLLAGGNPDAVEFHEKLMRLAHDSGFEYQPARDLAKSASIDEIVRRINVIETTDGVTADAVLGVAETPKIPISKLYEEYEALARVDNLDKSSDQLRRWRHSHIRYANNFISAVGDISLADIQRSDLLAFRRWQSSRIESGSIKPYTANRDMYSFAVMCKDVLNYKLGIERDIFSNLMFKQPQQKRRNRQVSFDIEWIETRFISDGCLEGLNADARDCFLVMINTGARPSEICNLNVSTINLDAAIPYISIEADGRVLKTVNSERRIPLIGESKAAMARHPNGFERYQNADAWSATINKYLKTNDLLPTVEHKAYSLRHSFSDRLKNVGCPDSIRNQLMGHAPDGTSYGEGASLEVTAAWIRKISL